eukprot:UN26948
MNLMFSSTLRRIFLGIQVSFYSSVVSNINHMFQSKASVSTKRVIFLLQ